jgi:hypothetical protein
VNGKPPGNKLAQYQGHKAILFPLVKDALITGILYEVLENQDIAENLPHFNVTVVMIITLSGAVSDELIAVSES